MLPVLQKSRQFIQRIQYWRVWGPEPRRWWQPHYDLTLSDGKVVSVEPEGVASAECPKSVVLRDPVSVELIQIVGQAQQVKGALGPPSTWPSAFYDVVSFLKVQDSVDEAAQRRAIEKG